MSSLDRSNCYGEFEGLIGYAKDSCGVCSEMGSVRGDKSCSWEFIHAYPVKFGELFVSLGLNNEEKT